MPSNNRPLLTVGNPKTAKGEGHGYLTAILHMAPHTLAGVGNLCVWSTAGCRGVCLNKAGRGGIFRKGESTNAIQEARKRKARAFRANRAAFLAQLDREVTAHIRRSERNGLLPAVRPNGTTDLRWEKLAPELFANHPDVQFYDYTKSKQRVALSVLAKKSSNGFPANYDLTYSRTEHDSTEGLQAMLREGARVAIPYIGDKGYLAAHRMGIGRSVNGDAHDLTFLQPAGSVLLLAAKGPAKHDYSGFVVRG